MATEKSLDAPLGKTSAKHLPPAVQPDLSLRVQSFRQFTLARDVMIRALSDGASTDVAADLAGMSLAEAESLISSDPIVQARLRLARGYDAAPLNEADIDPKKLVKILQGESRPSIQLLTQVRDDPTVTAAVRLKAAKILLDMNPDLVVAGKADIAVEHRHVLEIQDLEKMQNILSEVLPAPAIEVDFKKLLPPNSEME
jgi:hypothetical protein